MKTHIRKPLLLAGACLATCICDARSRTPQTLSISPSILVENAESLRKRDSPLRPALEELAAEADSALKRKPASVTDKDQLPASGDRHDYYSFGTYWWPDPSKPDGLPYIRRDGYSNPEAHKGNSHAFSATNKAVETLGLAYFFTGREAYAKKAAELARAWYLDPKTRMNPNMNHAQAIPGINDGRDIGLIDARSLTNLMDGIALIRPSRAWTSRDDAAMSKWLGDFYRWMRTSVNGLGEEQKANNHGVYYDVMATHLALYLGKRREAKARLEHALVRRLDAQIEPDGKQPHELARTRSFTYTVFNLAGFFQLATLAEATGENWWAHRGPAGQGLKAALDLIAPYADPQKPWDLGRQVIPAERGAMLPLLQQALRYEDSAFYRETLENHGADFAGERWRLTR